MSRRKPTTQATHDFPKLAQPAQRALQNAGLYRLEQLTQLSQAELLQLHGMGPKAQSQLRQALQARGLSFRDEKETSATRARKRTP